MKKRPINAENIFLIDAIGAIVSTFMLGFVLVEYESIIGMPSKILHDLAVIALIIAIYSLVCYFKKLQNWRKYLRVIAFTNGIYCFFTLFLVLFYFKSLTHLGTAYFIVEMIIVILLVRYELKIAGNTEKSIQD